MEVIVSILVPYVLKSVSIYPAALTGCEAENPLQILNLALRSGGSRSIAEASLPCLPREVATQIATGRKLQQQAFGFSKKVRIIHLLLSEISTRTPTTQLRTV